MIVTNILCLEHEEWYNADQQRDHPISYEELEMATINNNQELILKWLNSKGQKEHHWQKRLLKQAAYHHSSDVIKCILSFGNCDGK